MDGNFAAEHQRMKDPDEDVWMSDGDRYFVGREEYKQHLAVGINLRNVSTVN